MEEIEGDIPKVGIGRALTVILILHVVAIAAIYMGTKWKGDPAASNAVAAYDEDKDKDDTPSRSNSGNQHKFKVGEPSSYQEYQRSPEVSHQMPANNTRRVEIPMPEVVVTPQEPTQQPRVIRPRRNPNAHVNLPPVEEVRYKTHTIVAGDTIYRIAQKNNVKYQDILNINNIADAGKIGIGQKIKIPVK